MGLPEDVPPDDASRLSGRLWIAVRRFDDELAFSVLHRAFAVLSPGDVADLVVVPTLRRLGETWQSSERVVAAEHFTCQVVRTLFQAHSAGTVASGRLAVCFAPAGDQHDLGVHLAAAALVAAGWQTKVLGADTPLPCADAVVAELEPVLVVVGACMRPAAVDFLAGRGAHHVPALAGGAGFLAGDAQGRAGLAVHHGPFAAVPGVAERLLDRAAAGA